MKIIYIDIEIEGYGMNATENDKSRIWQGIKNCRSMLNI